MTFAQTGRNYRKIVASQKYKFFHTSFFIFHFMSARTKRQRRQSTDSGRSETTELPPSIEKTQQGSIH